MEMRDGETDAATETFETMVAGLKQHIFGPAEKGILDALKASQNIAKDVGAMALTLVQTAAEQAEQAGREYDLDMIMGVATEVIDDILELAEAAGIVEDSKDEALLEDSLFSAVEAYAQTVEPNSEEAEAAAQMLQQMADEGMVGEAESVIANMGARQGVDPFADDDGVQGVDPRAQAPQPAPQPTRELMAG
jgi:hypothetical protein